MDSDNILFENVLVSPETDAKLRTQSRLSVMDQILIQCLCIDIRNNNPKHGLITEQIGSYIQRVLVGVSRSPHAQTHPANWTVYSYSLLLKSYVDYENSRTKERAILQLQVLVDQLSNETTPLLSNKEANKNSAPVWERLMVGLASECDVVPLQHGLPAVLGDEEATGGALLQLRRDHDGAGHLPRAGALRGHRQLSGDHRQEGGGDHDGRVAGALTRSWRRSYAAARRRTSCVVWAS